MILKKRCIIRKRDVMEAAHLEQTQMLIIHSTPVEETGEKDGVHVETHQLRGGLIQADQTDTHCNCNHLERYLSPNSSAAKVESSCKYSGR